MSSQQILRDARDAGQLLSYGLAAGAARNHDADGYNDAKLHGLVQQYHGSAAFRDVVRQFAAGMRLQVVEVDARGIVLMAMTDSPFALDPASLRNYTSADDRLLDGLMQVAIAATVFPRPATLDDDPAMARPPVTVLDVERTLRDLSERLASEATTQVDPTSSAVRTGLIEAWRVYLKRPAVKKTADDRRASRTTSAMVERNLETLREYGCFVRLTRPNVDGGEQMLYQPTWRYQVQMQDFTATELFTLVNTILERPYAEGRTAPEPEIARDADDVGQDNGNTRDNNDNEAGAGT